MLYEINAHNVLIATQILIAYPTERGGGGLLRYIILIRPRKRLRGRRHRRLHRPSVARACLYRRCELNILILRHMSNIFGRAANCRNINS